MLVVQVRHYLAVFLLQLPKYWDFRPGSLHLANVHFPVQNSPMLITHLTLVTPGVGKGETPIGQTEKLKHPQRGEVAHHGHSSKADQRPETLEELTLLFYRERKGDQGGGWPYIANEEVHTEGSLSLGEQAPSPPTILGDASSLDRIVQQPSAYKIACLNHSILGSVLCHS